MIEDRHPMDGQLREVLEYALGFWRAAKAACERIGKDTDFHDQKIRELEERLGCEAADG